MGWRFLPGEPAAFYAPIMEVLSLALFLAGAWPVRLWLRLPKGHLVAQRPILWSGTSDSDSIARANANCGQHAVRRAEHCGCYERCSRQGGVRRGWYAYGRLGGLSRP